MACRDCKWLDVPAELLTREGRVRKSRDYHMFNCTVPFAPQAVPASFKAHPSYREPERGMMAPTYGDGCAFHAKRT
jgi:hypothetical protein